MRTCKKSPTNEVLYVKLDSRADRGEFEIWVTKPTYIGRCNKLGTRQVRTEDGYDFTNLNTAAKWLLEKKGEKDIADKLPNEVKNPPIVVTGMEVVLLGKWKDLCTLKNIDPSDSQAVAKSYNITEGEAKLLGVKKGA